MTALVRQPKHGDLLPVEQAKAILEKSTRVDEVKKIADQAAAIRLYMRRQRAALDSQNHATEIMLHSQARLGELTAAMPKAPGGRGKTGPKSGPVSKVADLAEQGITKQDASRWAKLADAKRSGKLDEHIESVKATNEKLTVSGAIAAVSRSSDYESDEWYTPPEYLDAVRKVLGGIDLDPASNADAQKTVKARRFLTPEQDGLSKVWKGRVFCNPPYSQPECGQFVAKFIEEHESGRMTAGIILLNASTDTRWFHDLASRFPVCFTLGRIAFLRRDGKPIAGNRIGQAFFYAGRSTAFAKVFGQLGVVMGAKR